MVLDLPDEISAGALLLSRRAEVHRASVIAILSANDEIARMTRVPFPYGDAEFDAWLALKDPHYVIVREGQVLGAIGARVDGPASTAEVGYWLAPHGRGQGAATRSLIALCSAMFDAGYARLYADVVPHNERSARVLKRAGFHFEGILRSVYAPMCGSGGRQDHARYSRLPEDPPPSI